MKISKLEFINIIFVILLIGVILGYSWRMYHESLPAPVKITEQK